MPKFWCLVASHIHACCIFNYQIDLAPLEKMLVDPAFSLATISKPALPSNRSFNTIRDYKYLTLVAVSSTHDDCMIFPPADTF